MPEIWACKNLQNLIFQDSFKSSTFFIAKTSKANDMDQTNLALSRLFYMFSCISDDPFTVPVL